MLWCAHHNVRHFANPVLCFRRNHDIPLFLKRSCEWALRSGISEGSRPGALCIGIIGYGVRYKAEERGVAVLRR